MYYTCIIIIIVNVIHWFQDNKNRKERELKKLKREQERERLAKERQEMTTTENVALRKKGKVPEAKEDECLVDVLLQEIQSGHFNKRRKRRTN